jgi:hypothetical protein
MELNKEQIEFLDTFAKGPWKVNDEVIDIEGSFDCSYKNLTDFKGIKFGTINRDFLCNNNKLTSLIGGPNEVNGDFYCDNNKLTSLEGLSKKISGNIYIDLGTSLKGLEYEMFDKVISRNKEGNTIRLTKLIQGLTPKGVNTNEYLKVLIEQINKI